MILILGRTDDASTTEVAKWLKHLRKEYLIIHGNDNVNEVKFVSCNLKEKQLIVSVNSKKIDLAQITSVWNRRDGFSFIHLGVDLSTKYKLLPIAEGDNYIKSLVREEVKFLLNYIHSYFALSNIKELGIYKNNVVNKLEVLEIASQVGLLVPDTYVFSAKQDLINLISLDPEIKLITKPISQGGVYKFTNEANYYSYVERITPAFINKIPESFFPSLFQKEIEKKYELRVFYLNNSFFSMVIFSQKNKSTQTDFRKPNNSIDEKTRMIPYSLPKKIEKKLQLLLEELGLNTASIDIIVDKNDNYIFLEVNPVGQFAMTSYPCNYYLEKKIAEYL